MNQRIACLTDQRGVALPMAMLALIILSALVIGFSVLSATEPTIASNQLMVAQARSVAEAGIEHAIWALNNPADPKGVPYPLVGAAPAPYDGSQLVMVSTGTTNIGGFRVTVTTGAAACPTAADRCITAVGWVPNDTTTNPKAHQRITVSVTNPQLVFKDPPAALSVRGELDIGGNANISSIADQTCGKKVGTLTTGTTNVTGAAADIWGAADNNLVHNEITDAANGSLPDNSHDVVKNLSTDTFDQYIFTDKTINFLRTYAKAHGTYLQGTVVFDSGNKIPNGLVFVDTTTGQNITQEGVTPPTPATQFANVSIHGNPPADPSGIFSGWLFVNGTLSVDGNFLMHGLMYAQNDISYHGIGTGGVWGALMSRNIRDLSSTSIDSDLLGNALINYNCAYAKNGGGTIPFIWNINSGSYRELCDSCA
ncbi:MAG TPA: pilus assembly PilX N-terminal domain-containing protein [Methylomirabilota bacterium]|jgi:hypothetical protein|nr:pilus assembly PilX N-terminal domain-containing protein [Methylomirabilota bacterium]